MALITGISLENFKGINNRVSIPLKPLTLLFGANSAGKSTILQAFNYAYEVLFNKNPDPFYTEKCGEFLNLGGFHNLVNRSTDSENKEIVIRIDFKVDDDGLMPFAFGDTFDEELNDYVNKYLKINEAFIEFRVNGNIGVFISEYSVGLNDEWVAIISEFNESRRISHINLEHELFKQEIEERTLIEEIPELSEINFREGSYTRPFVNQPTVIPDTNKPFAPIVPGSDSFASFSVEHVPLWACLSQLLIRPLQLLQAELQKMIHIGPLRLLPERNFVPAKSETDADWYNGMSAWVHLYKVEGEIESELVKKCNQHLKETLSIDYELQLTRFKLIPKYGLIGTSILVYDENRDIEFFNQRIKTPFEEAKSIKQIELLNLSDHTQVGIQDVGIGISQIIPVVVAAVDYKKRIVAIEQPELHVHPAIACNLGDLFIREFVGQDRLCLIETHSEHLVLRLLRRIRETSAANGDFDPSLSISPSDIAVITIENIDGNISMVEIPVRDDGEFSRKWPKGFFEEREEELF